MKMQGITSKISEYHILFGFSHQKENAEGC